MPRKVTERPISEHLQTLYRVKRQLELKKIAPARLKRIQAHLTALLKELHEVE